MTIGSRAFDKLFVGQVDDLRLHNRALAGDEIDRLAVHYRPRMILSG